MEPGVESLNEACKYGIFLQCQILHVKVNMASLFVESQLRPQNLIRTDKGKKNLLNNKKKC